jgi:dienelactone hydrolase
MLLASMVNRLMVGILALIAVTAIAAGVWSANHTPAPAGFTSGGKTIAVERFDPPIDATGPHPAVIFLHGADGLRIPLITAAYRLHCRELSSQGYVVLLVRYMDRTDGQGGDLLSNVVHFRAWMETIRDAVTYASHQPGVDPDQIGLCGMSLGASLAMSTAIFDPRVKATVEYFGPLPDAVVPSIKQMCPVLILHGERDPLVNVEEAHKAARIFREKHVSFEMKIYPDQGHGFTGEANREAFRRELAFFATHLR